MLYEKYSKFFLKADTDETFSNLPFVFVVRKF